VEMKPESAFSATTHIANVRSFIWSKDFTCLIISKLIYNFFTYLFFIVVLGRDTLWHLWNLSQYIKYIIHEFTPFITILYPPLPAFLK
jgi:hypothetical protein